MMPEAGNYRQAAMKRREFRTALKWKAVQWVRERGLPVAPNVMNRQDQHGFRKTTTSQSACVMPLICNASSNVGYLLGLGY